ncbi:30S ribosomal protein S18 [bacterium]|nr:30S ribosomal protein S18 [bacterium]MBU1637164.1 30S ribosomal protein S18 [bacterium]
MAYQRSSQPGRPPQRRNRFRIGGPRKPSFLEEHGIDYIDYKDTKLLLRFLSPQGKILPRRLTRLNKIQQTALTTAVKRARHLALIPFVTDTEHY